MSGIEETFNRAIAHHQAGRLVEAAEVYRQVLQADANYVNALHLLGLLEMQRKNHAESLALLERAVALKGDFGRMRETLGSAYRLGGRLDDAIAQFREAVRLDPGASNAWMLLGQALQQKGQVAEASECFRKVTDLQPAFVAGWVKLGEGAAALGQRTDAVVAYQRALANDGTVAEVHNNLGVVLMDEGRFSEATASLREAVRLKPAFAAGHCNLGNALKAAGQVREAIINYRRAIEIDPRFAQAYNNLSTAMADVGERDEALETAEKAVALAPGFAEAYNNLGNAYKDAGRLDEAVAAYRKAVEIKPGYAAADSNLLYALLFHPAWEVEAIWEEHKRWARVHAERLRAEFGVRGPGSGVRETGRRIRVGYVSPDLREHVIGLNMLPVLCGHDRGKFEVFVYSDVKRTDGVTDRIKAAVAQWRDVRGKSDAEVAEMVRADAIDILVDLTLHLAGNRLLMFARKPAPMQVTFAGYPGTTGMKAIDYRLSDPYLEPPGMFDAVSAEEIIRLPRTFWCYAGMAEELEVGGLPAKKEGKVTFGCLNTFCKLNDGMLRLWARVMREVPGSEMRLLLFSGKHRERTIELMASEGIAPERITFSPRVARQEYLALHRRIDIGVDTLPYNGHTTSLDAYWMGVPVVTLVGKTIVGRAGLSQLSNLGLTELVAWNEDEFVQIAAGLAKDLDRVAKLRAGLRERMRRSALMDAAGFVRGIEDAYVWAWARK